MDSEHSQYQVQFLKETVMVKDDLGSVVTVDATVDATRDHNSELSQMLDVPHLLSTTKTLCKA